MNTQSTSTISIERDEEQRVGKVLLSNGWSEEVDRNEYVKARYRSPLGSVAILYSSGKLVFQGKQDFNSLILDIKQESSEESSSFVDHIGVDEVGKGDYFGPLVVVSCFVDREFEKRISLLGFGDSKRFSDRKILELFKEIEEYPYYFSSVVVPAEYNRLVLEYGNVAVLLAKQHSIVIEKGLSKLKLDGVECKRVVIDQFSSSKDRVRKELGELGSRVELIQFHKGESDLAVAAASIIARAIFLKEWEKMNERYDLVFPKGATSVVEFGKEFVSKYGEDELRNVAKIGFRTTDEILKLF
ncbi:MAG: ribonuclease HIII [Candidatus Dojkabacteria bacterium]